MTNNAMSPRAKSPTAATRPRRQARIEPTTGLLGREEVR